MTTTAVDEIGPCPCGCGDDAPRGRLYAHPDRCKQRAYRARVKAEAKALGRPASVSLKALHAPDPSRDGNGDREKPRQARQKRRRDGVQVYLPSLGAAEALKTLLDVVDGDVWDQAVEVHDLDQAQAALEKAIARRRARA